MDFSALGELAPESSRRGGRAEVFTGQAAREVQRRQDEEPFPRIDGVCTDQCRR